MSTPKCIIAYRTEPFSGRVQWAMVCSWCEREYKETADLNKYLPTVAPQGCQLSHGICTEHYQREMEKLKLA